MGLRQEELLLAFFGTKLTVGSVRVLQGQEVCLRVLLLEGGHREQCTHTSCRNRATVSKARLIKLYGIPVLVQECRSSVLGEGAGDYSSVFHS